MAIKRWVVTGDCHGNFSRFFHPVFLKEEENPSEIGIIVLGDFGVNFYLNNTDKKNKRKLEETGFNFFIVRGNHEARPENLPSIQCNFKSEINGKVLLEEEFPHIWYLLDNQVYTFGEHTALVINGAYSVDKWYRLRNVGLTGEEDKDYIAKRAGWFADEQLTPAEMERTTNFIKDKKVDFVFSHTCPSCWKPFDLFLTGINQSTVDNTMENWMESIKDLFDWKIWLWAHYHADRIERSRCEMFFQDIEDLDTIWNRWYGRQTFKEEYWLEKSPNFYLGL